MNGVVDALKVERLPGQVMSLNLYVMYGLMHSFKHVPEVR